MDIRLKKMIKIHEAGLLNLNSNKSFKILKWRNILNFNDTLKMTAEWYKEYFRKKKVEDFSLRQIKIYKDKLKENLLK